MIYSALKRYKWPGRAAVVVSVVHVRRGEMAGPFELDGGKVDLITAFLFHRGGHENPATLKANEGKSFIGSYVLGMGFTFDDTDKKGVANPISLMHELIAKDPRNAVRIFPYIGGEEVNESSAHAHHRYVINFGDMSEEEARQWPDLLRIVEQNVKPERLRQNREIRAKYWWRFAEVAPALYRAIADLDRVLVRSLTSTHFSSFAYLPGHMVYDQTLIVFVLPRFWGFAVLASRVHELWCLALGATMKDDPRYNVRNCFDTFPFPESQNARLERVGAECYAFRSELMIRRGEGLTKTYNRFHDPDQHDIDIVKFRELHAAIDRAALDAYDWSDIPAACEFFPEHEAEQEGDDALARRRAKYRYRWPDDVRDEVLARLLELNRLRAEEERLLAPEEEKAPPKPRGKRGKKAPSDVGPSVLF
jgi:hypothetical protein